MPDMFIFFNPNLNCTFRHIAETKSYTAASAEGSSNLSPAGITTHSMK